MSRARIQKIVGIALVCLMIGLIVGGLLGMSNTPVQSAVSLDDDPLHQLPATYGKISYFASDDGHPGECNPAAWGELLGERCGSDEDTKYWYSAMRWPYVTDYVCDNARFVATEIDADAMSWWHNKKILVTNPANGKQVVLLAKDWGPNPCRENTRDRVIDVSRTAMDVLGVETDNAVDIEFADQDQPLGIVFPLYGQGEQRHQRSDKTWYWADDMLGTCADPLRTHGCAVTSTAMAFKYYGEQILCSFLDIANQPLGMTLGIDPGELNQWLSEYDVDSDGTKNDGYVNGCDIVWSRADDSRPRVEWAGWIDNADYYDRGLPRLTPQQLLERIRNELDQGYSVIASVRYQGSPHFVVVTGYSQEDGTYFINDPIGNGDRITIPGLRYPSSPESEIRGIRIYHGPHIDVLEPTQPHPVSAGSCNAPDGIQVRVSVTVDGAGVTGLDSSDFRVEIGGKRASFTPPTEEPGGTYVLDVLPPAQDVAGDYRLTIALFDNISEISGVSYEYRFTSDVELGAVMYETMGVPRPTVGEGATSPQAFIDCYDRNGGTLVLGVPINTVHRWGNGYIQDFRGGEGYEGAIMQRDGEETAYAAYGSIWSTYITHGGAGSLGYPLIDETALPLSSVTCARSRYNIFEHGAIAHRTATAGHESVTVWLGWGIFNKWEQLNYGQSVLGLPTSDQEEATPSGASGFDTTGIAGEFEGGHIYWHRTGNFANQAFETHGAINAVYSSMGATASWLGFPISDEYIAPTGYARSNFEGGYITTTDGVNYQAFHYAPTPTEPLPAIVTIDLVADTGEFGNLRPISLQPGDEIVQFTRDNLVVGSNPSAAITTVFRYNGTVSGDLSGSMSIEGQVVSIWWSEISPNGKGYGFSKVTIDCGSGNTFEGFRVADMDYELVEPGVERWYLTGYMWLWGTGAFDGQVLVGTITGGTFNEDAELDYETLRSSATLRSYSGIEIMGPYAVGGTGTITPGDAPRVDLLSGDEIMQFTRSNIVVSANQPAYYGEGYSLTGSATGYLAGSASATMNSLYLTVSGFGWAFFKLSYSGASGTLTALNVVDLTGDYTARTSYGYAFAPKETATGEYVGKDYIAVISGTSNPLEGSATLLVLVPVVAHKTETTEPGDDTVDATAEADTEIYKSGSGTPTVTVASFDTNPGTVHAFSSIGDYIDVSIDNPADVNEIEIKLHYTDAEVAGVVKSSLRLHWWDGSAWTPCSDSGVDTEANYIWARIRSDTTPNLSQLTGTPFAGGGQAAPAACFIATAAYGTSTAEELDVLRDFRDEVLLQNSLGSTFVDLYYALSPPLADFISEHEPLRMLVRELLVDPTVWVVEATEPLWGN